MFVKNFFKSIAAGMAIAIACLVSANSGNTVFNNVLPAFIFAIGLMIVVKFDLNLYTGKIGYAKSLKDFASCGLYLIGNVVGVAIICLSFKGALLNDNYRLLQLYSAKFIDFNIVTQILLVLTKGIGCGFLMYCAVDIYKKSKSLLGVFTCVPAFILAGFEHSVADVAYIMQYMRYGYDYRSRYALSIILFWLIVVIGNAIGAQIHRIWDKE